VDNGTVFLLDKAIVVFPVVTASGKRDTIVSAPDLGGVVEEGTELDPAGSDVGGSQGMQVLALSGLSTVVNRENGYGTKERKGYYRSIACILNRACRR